MSVSSHRHASLLLFVLLTLLSVVACGQKPQEKILGRWQEVSSEKGVFEFFQDQTLTMTSKNKAGKSQQMSGKWIVLDDGRLKFDLVMLGTSVPSVVKFRFDGSDMVFITDGGTEARFKKLP